MLWPNNGRYDCNGSFSWFKSKNNSWKLIICEKLVGLEINKHAPILLEWRSIISLLNPIRIWYFEVMRTGYKLVKKKQKLVFGRKNGNCWLIFGFVWWIKEVWKNNFALILATFVPQKTSLHIISFFLNISVFATYWPTVATPISWWYQKKKIREWEQSNFCVNFPTSQ